MSSVSRPFVKRANVSALVSAVGLGPALQFYRRSAISLFAAAGQRVVGISADSQDTRTVNRVRRLLAGRELDLLFIDGDHTYAGVSRDFAMYSGLVARGGLIVFHDIVEDFS